VTPPFEGSAREVGLELRRLLAQAGPRAVHTAFRRMFTKDAVAWDRAVAQKMRGPLHLDTPKDPGADLATRSGALRGARFSEISGNDLTTLTLRKGSTSPYARLQELGGTIVPVRRKWLALPTSEVLTASGVPQRPGPRSYDLEFVKKANSDDTAFLFEKRAKGSSSPSRLMYVLKKRVEIPARPVYQPAHEARGAARLKDLRRFLVEEMAKGTRGRGGAR